MASVRDTYDSTLLGILSNEGEITNFLDVVIGFLYRRTDFFRIMKSKNDKLGFPPGTAAKLLLKEFKKYEAFAQRDEMEREKKKGLVTLICLSNATESVAIYSSIFKLYGLPVDHNFSANFQVTSCQCYRLKLYLLPVHCVSSIVCIFYSSKEAPTHPPGISEMKTSEQQQVSSTTTSKTNTPAATSTPQTTTATTASTTTVPSTGGAGDVKAPPSQNKDADEDTRASKQQQAFQNDPLSYNGAVREKYVWSQSISDVDIRIFVPPYIKKGKQVEVTVEKRHLRVCYRDDKGVSQTVVDGNLTWDVNKEECMWSLVPAEHVHVSLEKREERWWESALEDEPKINVRNIDCSRPMTDLDDEAQAKIGEMMFNEQQKRLGLPQSHEQKQHE
ncbi:nudC domain-containing protein 3-like [Haliotis rubra]|uniref:nudC domain-containing protein 3-like n=1 Tax=Haliotis rubra TaxID=36100 RepID=UPI001EE559A5|nr:nudC domain-containing protein 3-like [Haliotis rubra]